MRGSLLAVTICGSLIFSGWVAAQEEEENPHLEMMEDRFICLDCHTRIPEAGESSPDYFLVDLPSENCLGCHSEVEHTGVAEHLGQAAEPLPGDENQKIACFTCHDPHPQGAIEGRIVYDARMDRRNRDFVRILRIPEIEKEFNRDVTSKAEPEVYLKLPMDENKICTVCHSMERDNQWRKRIRWDNFFGLFSY